jgi:hypothetical protein
MAPQRSESVPVAMKPVFVSIVALTDKVCMEHLNDEYRTISRELAAALARKRPSPLSTGRPEVWACGILHALGSVNFLFDKSQTPHMRATELCAAFGVNQTTGVSKSKQIRDLLGMGQFDPRWCLPSLLAENPLVWMLDIDGFIQDIRDMPRDVQEQAYQQGLIPWIPADRQE